MNGSVSMRERSERLPAVSYVADALAILGVAALVATAALVNPLFGLAAGGLAALLIALVVELALATKSDEPADDDR